MLAHVVYALLLFPASLVRPLLGPLRALLPILDSTNRTIANVTSFTDQEDVTSGVCSVCLPCVCLYLGSCVVLKLLVCCSVVPVTLSFSCECGWFVCVCGGLFESSCV